MLMLLLMLRALIGSRRLVLYTVLCLWRCRNKRGPEGDTSSIPGTLQPSNPALGACGLSSIALSCISLERSAQATTLYDHLLLASGTCRHHRLLAAESSYFLFHGESQRERRSCRRFSISPRFLANYQGVQEKLTTSQ